MSRFELAGSERPVDTLLATAGLAGLSVVTAAAFNPLFTGGDMLRRLVTTALIVHAVSLALRLLRWPWWAAVPVQLLSVVVVTATFFHPDSLAGSLVPTNDTWMLLRDDLRGVWEQFPTAPAPVPGQSGFGVAGVLTIGLVTLLSDTFAFRAQGRLEAVAPAAVAFIVAAAIREEREQIAFAVAWVAIALTALAFLRASDDAVSTWIGRRGHTVLLRRATGAMAIVLAAVGSAAWLAPRLPGAGEPALVDTRNSSNEVTEVLSPLVDIRSRLVNRSDTVLFTVEATQPAYWRLTGLPRFDGRTWNLPDRELSEAGGPLGAVLSAGPLIDQVVEVRALGGNLVPAAYTPVAAGARRGTGGSDDVGLYYVGDTSTLVVTGSGLRRGLQIEVVSQSPAPGAFTLQRATSVAPPSSEYLSLPESFPEDFRELARSITAGAASPYEQAMALQNWFRTEFTYDLEVPAGHSDDAIADFLERRRGYCEQFAGTFAAFARSLGVPARVAVGFTQGESDGDGIYVVRGRHAHAWPEVWFDGVGWVLFEPTPGRGAPAADSWTGVPPEQDPGPTGPGGDTDGSSPSTAPPVAPTLPTEDPFDQGGPDGTGTPTTVALAGMDGGSRGGGRGLGAGSAFVLTILLVSAWLVAMPRMVTRWVRARRQSPTERIIAAWAAAARALAETGARPRPGDTPTEHARRAARLTGLDPSSLQELAHYATKAVYAVEEPGDRAALRCEHLRAYVVNATRDMVPWTTRALERIDPRRVAALA